jgi:hypothetical protein
MPSNTEPKTILLKGEPIAAEATGTGAITPGHVLELLSTGNVQVGTVLLAQPLSVAREEDYVGGAIDTPFVAGDRIPYYVARPGDEFWALVSAAVTRGARLECAGGGQLRTLTTGVPLAVALDTTVGAGRCRVRAI